MLACRGLTNSSEDGTAPGTLGNRDAVLDIRTRQLIADLVETGVQTALAIAPETLGNRVYVTIKPAPVAYTLYGSSLVHSAALHSTHTPSLHKRQHRLNYDTV